MATEYSTTHLKYCMLTAAECGIKKHPHIVMKELGITYQHAMLQSLFDQWWFWGCENIPAVLPKYLTVLDEDPAKWGINGH